MVAELKLDILEFFYEHIEEQDWLDGLELYQAGKAVNVVDHGGLITGLVQTLDGKSEVRLKLHPSGRCIQWIECTCKKNRAYNRYCEHMAAFMIHVDRENPKLLGNLDSRMPLKPPIFKSRNVQSLNIEHAFDDKSEEKQLGAAQKILDHLKGSIHSVSLLAQGPTLRVRLEIKPGQLTHYDLKLDQAARFLLAHPELKTASAEVRQLKVYEEPVLLGTRIYPEDEETIVAERVLAIKSKKSKLHESSLSSVTKNHKLISKDRLNEPIVAYEITPFKNAAKYLGKEYFFIPEQGFWPVNRQSVSSVWYELPLKKVFKDDTAAELINNHYAEFIGEGNIFLDEQLIEQSIIELPQLNEIRIFSEQDGWFTLDPHYGTGEGAVSMVALLKKSKKEKRAFIKAGKSWLKIPEFITEHDWHLDESGNYLKVNSLGLLRLKAALGDFDHFVGKKGIISKIHTRLEFSPELAVHSLSHTKLNLRSYQETGLKWFWWLYTNSLHGLLADEMGLGKTHQAMAVMSAIQVERKHPKFLVICPTTVLEHWEDKINDFCPNLKPIVHHGPKRIQSFGGIGDKYFTVVTSYGVLLRDIRNLQAIKWDAIILDEAHFVKNNATATYKAVCKLEGSLRICLTGTPMENHLGELKNLFDFLVPGYLGSDNYFRKNFISPIETRAHPERELELQKLIHPFKLRRTKEQVLSDLPEKVEDIRHCHLSKEQVKLYRDTVQLRAKPLINQLEQEGNPVPYLHVFATLTLLKQICDHPALVAKDSNYERFESGKFELLKDLIEDALGSNHKIVIYSQYVSMVKIIEDYLSKKAVGHVTLTGQSRNRGQIVSKFQNDDQILVFCGSLLAGGIGIDLTAASVVIHYDRWWNASKENQATDRVHRIGQNKNVQVMKLVTKGTLEEKIDELIKSKQSLFERFLDRDEEVFKNLTRQELIELLQ